MDPNLAAGGPPDSTSGDLVADRDAFRRLARSLVRDDAAADDLLQGAALRAIERSPTDAGTPIRSMRGFLARVIRNLGGETRRADSRRLAREQAGSLPEATPSAAELAARHEQRVRLMQAVSELPEPYRESILLRFFEELPPRKIAARLGVPVKTIDSRLQRAIALLRQRLDERHGGDRRAWLAALIPLTKSPAAATLVSIGATLMKAKAIVAVLVLCALTAIVFSIGTGGDRVVVEKNSDRASAPLPMTPPPIESKHGDAPARIAVAAETAKKSVPPTPSAPAQRTVRGRVVDLGGTPVPGVAVDVTWSGAGHDRRVDRVTSGAAGSFDIVVETDEARAEATWEETCSISSADPRFAPVLDAELRTVDASVKEITIVVAPSTLVSGRVIDDRGEPIADASIEISLPSDTRARLAFDLTSAKNHEWRTGSANDGVFEFAAAPAIAGSRCGATSVGHANAERLLDRFPATGIELVLALPKHSSVIEGVVTGPDAVPLPDASVAFGDTMHLRCGKDGKFRFEFDAEQPPERITAVARGLRPVTIERGNAAWPAFVELHLTERPLSLAGVVLDADGRPLPQAEVWVTDNTLLASVNGDILIAEIEMTGDGAVQRSTRTDAAGKFVLPGLVDRTYHLAAMDSKRAWRIEAGDAAAGRDDLVIRFPETGLHRSLHGVVRDLAGRPVPRATVVVILDVLAAEDPVSHARYFNQSIGSQAAVGDDGAFVLKDVPFGATLRVNGADVAGNETFELAEPPIEPLTLTVARRCWFRVDLAAPPPGATAMRFFDANGGHVTITRSGPGRTENFTDVPLADGHSERLLATDAVRAFVVVDAKGVELARRDLRLTPGEENVVR